MPSSIPHASGIYQIVCVPTGKIYIGSAVDLYVRWREHRRMLRLGTHHSRHLQRAWRKYGESSFEFQVLELILSPFLIEREQYWLDRLRPFERQRGFNCSRQAGTTAGVFPSDETRQRMSRSKSGRAHSREHVENQAATTRRSYVFVSPDKEIIYVSGMAQFCRSVGLPTSPIGRLITRRHKYRSYKGWQCFRADDPNLDEKIESAITYIPPVQKKNDEL